MSGRRSISDEAVSAAWRSFVACGGSSMREYAGWSQGRDVPSLGTMRGRGCRFHGFAGVPRWPVADDVTMPTAPAAREVAVIGWLFLNGTESAKALGQYLGRRVKCHASLPARRRGAYGWASTDLDRIHPDQTCGASR
jgi:hypothetical protein